MPKPTIWPKLMAATTVRVMTMGSLVPSNQNIGKANAIQKRLLPINIVLRPNLSASQPNVGIETSATAADVSTAFRIRLRGSPSWVVA